MNDSEHHDEQALQAQLSVSHERLDALAVDLRAIDDELEEVSSEREAHRLLSGVCQGLEKLSELGAADLFWDERAANGAAEQQLRQVRGRIDAFEKLLGEIEDRRQVVVDQIALEQETSDFLEDDILEAQRLAEERKLEWIVEREVDELPGGVLVMPWSRVGEEDARFRKNLAAALLLSLLLGLILPMINLPIPEAWEPLDVPDRFTQLIRQEALLPPPPPQQTTRPEEVEPEPTEELVAEEGASESSDEALKPEPASKGILAFREKFSGLAENDPAARLGAQARITNEGEAALGLAGRSMVATQAAGSSGGINLAALSRDVGQGGEGRIQGVQVARATSSIGNGSGTDRPLSNGPGPGRTDEEIQIVFDRHKAALYRLYNRELRRDPTLQGQMVLRLRIEPDGSVSLCELQSSDMNAPMLSSQVVARVGNFDFGAKEGVPPVTILYPIDFLPAI